MSEFQHFFLTDGVSLTPIPGRNFELYEEEKTWEDSELLENMF